MKKFPDAIELIYTETVLKYEVIKMGYDNVKLDLGSIPLHIWKEMTREQRRIIINGYMTSFQTSVRMISLIKEELEK